MPSPLHQKQNQLAVKWAKKQGFSVVASDIAAAGARERADVIAFRSECSLMIESKVTRADLFADLKKPERSKGGVGLYRFYITPVDLVKPSEIPPGWGLLFAEGNNVTEIIKPTGNIWPSKKFSHKFPDWAAYQHDVDIEAEYAMLFSISRRLINKQPIN